MAQIDSNQIKDLIQRAEASRESLTRAGENFKAAANIGSRLRVSMSENGGVWIVSAGVVGVLFGKLFSHKKVAYVNKKTGTTEAAAKGGMFVAGLGLVFQLARPILQKLLIDQLGIYSQKYQTHRSQTGR